jgi:hypothetical protein
MAILMYFIMTPQTVFAQKSSDSQVYLSIEIEGNPLDTLPMFVFVRGKLSGIVPGIIALPSEGSATVEIGVAQLNQSPLYSFNFSPEVLNTHKLDIITANIDQISVAEKNFLILHKDFVKSIELTRIVDKVYGLKLPGIAPLLVTKYKEKSDVFADVSVKKADDYGLSSHLIYNESEQKAVSMGSADNWSGTNTIAFATGGIGYISERQKWTIQSQPPGAEIYTETNPGRSEGKTNSTIEVTKSISSYAILKMNGYEQCVIHMNEYQQCTEKDCSKDESADGSVTFTCTLKKVRINR